MGHLHIPAMMAGMAESHAGSDLRRASGSIGILWRASGGLPATRFVVGAYLSFCTDKSLLEAVACSVTELFSPVIISGRVPAMLARYDYIREDILEYFKPRPVQASRDADYALAYVRQEADTA